MNENIVDIFDKWLASRLSNVHTMLPGTILSYSGHSKRKAEVLPMIKKESVNLDIIDVPSIQNVPVIFPSTKKASVLFPLEKGDGVMLVFSEAGFQNWINGDNETQVDPGDRERFSLSDCVAVPGLFPFGGVPDAPANDTSLFVQYKDSVVEMDGTNINFNNGDKGTARLDDEVLNDDTTDSAFFTWLAGVWDAFANAAPTPQDGGAAIQTAVKTYLAVNPAPTKLDGKINSASDTVTTGD
jgi:hypothetical protein